MSKQKLTLLGEKLKQLVILGKDYTDTLVASEKVYLIEKASANTGYFKTYILAAGVAEESEVSSENLIGYIDIPKNFNDLGVPKIFLIPSDANANSYNYECRVLCNSQGLSSATNFPPSAVYGILEAKTWSNGCVTQEYRGLETPSYHYFRKSDNGGESWSTWTQL